MACWHCFWESDINKIRRGRPDGGCPRRGCFSGMQNRQTSPAWTLLTLSFLSFFFPQGQLALSAIWNPHRAKATQTHKDWWALMLAPHQSTPSSTPSKVFLLDVGQSKCVFLKSHTSENWLSDVVQGLDKYLIFLHQTALKSMVEDGKETENCSLKVRRGLFYRPLPPFPVVFFCLRSASLLAAKFWPERKEGACGTRKEIKLCALTFSYTSCYLTYRRALGWVSSLSSPEHLFALAHLCLSSRWLHFLEV